jgi:N-methylhydantoinase A
VFSAVGLVMADIRHDFVESRILREERMTAESLGPLYAALEQSADEALTEDGIPPDDHQLRRSADLRYVGQAYEVNVPVPDGGLDGAAVETIVQRFHELHLQLYAHNHLDKSVEFVSGRVAAIGLTSAPPLTKLDHDDRAAVPRECRPVYFEESGGFVDTDVVDRGTLGPGSVEQVDSTIVIHPRQKVSVDEFGNLLISI